MLKKIINDWHSTSNMSGIITKIYIFGSYVKTLQPKDVDILLVYLPIENSDYSRAIKCRQELAKVIFKKLNRVADITLLSENEEKTSFFAKRESAKLIWRR